jgi:hypothetical protein
LPRRWSHRASGIKTGPLIPACRKSRSCPGSVRSRFHRGLSHGLYFPCLSQKAAAIQGRQARKEGRENVNDPIVVWPPGTYYFDCGQLEGTYYDCSYDYPQYSSQGAIVCCPVS